MKASPNTKATAHTPTPWHVTDKPDSDWVDVESDCMGVARLPRDRYAVADAAFIVRACNAHDDLVAALERTLSWLTSYPGGGTMGSSGPYEQARAALAKAAA